DNVTVRWIKSGPARVAALLTGDVDLIASVPTTDVEQLENNPDISMSCDQTSRLMYWSLDVSKEHADHITAKDGSPIKNPFRDLRVRQALNVAIDRNAIVDDVMSGLAVPANQISGEGFGGFNADIPVPEYDVDRAKALLAEAGYADGFKLTLHATNNRYINDAKQAQAIAQMLTRIGIDVEVVTQPVSGYYGKLREHEMSMALIGWSSATGEASAILAPALSHGVRNNYGQWEHVEFNQLIEGALSTSDLAEYDRLLQEATAVAMADLPIIPSHFQVACWASKKGLHYIHRADEATLAESLVRQ
ncbi:MAG: peptide/nickel transport system substrate-binding protein, partial [Gammaproteobacteria bacterium]